MIAVLTGCQFLDQLLGSDLSPLSSPIACLCDESVAVFQFPGEFVKVFFYQIKGQLSAGAERCQSFDVIL